MPALDFPDDAPVGTIWPQSGTTRWRYAGGLIWRILSFTPPQDAGPILTGTYAPVNGVTTALFLGQIYIAGESDAYVCVRLSPSTWKKMTGVVTSIPDNAILYNGEPILYNGEPILFTPA